MSPHGTHSRYVGGCRCNLCADARRTYMRAYRARLKERRSGAFLGKPAISPDATSLDAAVAKIGQDFPALGALVRDGWLGAA